MREQFKQDVDKGLRMSPKRLPSKYFYDKTGDALFVEIMKLPEYYLTRAEHDIFKNKTEELIDLLGFGKGDYIELIELGAGDGIKTMELLNALCDKNFAFEYCPIDISENALNLLEKSIENKCPNLHVNPLQGDYFKILERLKDSNHKKVVLFLGSNIGNMDDSQATAFLGRLGGTLNKGDKLLLGVDLVKSKEIVLPAYNDSKGVTRAFNFNLLKRINAELEADFDLDGFDHKPEYDERTGIARSYLESMYDQTASIAGLGEYRFDQGERILMEISRKYNDEILAEILKSTLFGIQTKLLDTNKVFADYILEVT